MLFAMSKFFDDSDLDRTIDEGVSQNHSDAFSLRPNTIKSSKNGGISTEAYLNDYRNRMPYHYVEEGTDGYYYWQYGSTMVIEFEISDEVTATDSTAPYVTNVRVAGRSVVNPSTMVAELGSMSLQSTSTYFTTSQVEELLSRALKIANTAQIASAAATAAIARIEEDLYSLSGPNYLMSKLVEGTNVSIQRDTTDSSCPKLRISMVGGGGSSTSLLVTQGAGSIEEPFVVTTPAIAQDDILLTQASLTIVFSSLPLAGIAYDIHKKFYLQVTTAISGSQVLEFTVTGLGYNNLEDGVIKNGFYQLAGGKLFDTQNVNQLPYYGPTEGNHYQVEDNKPFIFIRGTNTELIINKVSFTQVICSDAATSGIITMPIADLPANCPLIAVCNTVKVPHELALSFSHLPPTYIENTVIPAVEEKVQISTNNVSLTESLTTDTDW